MKPGNCLYTLFLILAAVIMVPRTASADPTTLVCASSDPSSRSPTLQLDETQGIVTFTWNDRVLALGEVKSGREAGTFQAFFDPRNVTFDINKGDRDDHYVLSRITGVLTADRYEVDRTGTKIGQGELSWRCTIGQQKF